MNLMKKLSKYVDLLACAGVILDAFIIVEVLLITVALSP